jgi:hypothetical protein
MGSSYRGYWGAYKTESLGNLVVSGANTVALAFGQPVDVKRLILVTTVAVTVANAKLTIGVRKRDDTSSVSHSAYTVPFTGSAINDVQYIELPEPDTAAVVAVDGLDTHAATPNILEIDSDEELFVTSDGGATAGACDIYAMVQEQGFQPASARSGTAVKLVRVAV